LSKSITFRAIEAGRRGHTELIVIAFSGTSRRVRFVSPTGGLFIPLSASGFAMMAATTAQCQYLLNVIPEKEPDLLRERHINVEIG
jgi:hypothetical protein